MRITTPGGGLVLQGKGQTENTSDGLKCAYKRHFHGEGHPFQGKSDGDRWAEKDRTRNGASKGGLEKQYGISCDIIEPHKDGSGGVAQQQKGE